MSISKLPGSFADLEPLLVDWCLDCQPARIARLSSVSLQELRQFYDTMLPRMDDILDHLNKYDLDKFDDAESALMKLALTFAETAHPIDLKWKMTKIDTPFPSERLQMVGPALDW